MVIYVNDEKKDLQVSATVADLFNELNLPSLQGIAVAVNQQIVMQTNWASTTLKENDEVLVISATKGG
jgi:sulfur carrier protein